MKPFQIENQLGKTLEKIRKKDVALFEAIYKKILDIISKENLDHYKNLKAPMHRFKRVHVKKSFVLIFKVQEEMVIFVSLEHHDDAYR